MNREIKHKQSGNSPNKYAHFKDKIKHYGLLPSFGIYSIAYLNVIKQHIFGKVYVKFAAGQFVNLDLT